MNTPRLIQFNSQDPTDVRKDVLAGLSATQAAVSPKYFYDALGSRLFSAITELAEYYPTRTEAAIIERYLPEIGQAIGPVHSLLDLGAGNCEKAARLLGPFGVRRYIAVDISAEYLGESLRSLAMRFPKVEMLGVGEDFSQALELPVEAGSEPRLVFYPGSSIGNFTPQEAAAFLSRAHAVANGGGILIGVDLVKPRDVLEAAYADSLGVTAAFNRNLLSHLNRLVGTDFDIRDWRHVAFFNEEASRIEMHLECLKTVMVRWPEGERRFEHGERIHTENSYKWQPEAFSRLLLGAGFSASRGWKDERGWFSVFFARA